jgi:hypothetical protein
MTHKDTFLEDAVAEFGTRFVSRIDDDTSVIGKTVGEGITDTTFWRKEAMETWLRTKLTEALAEGAKKREEEILETMEGMGMEESLGVDFVSEEAIGFNKALKEIRHLIRPSK